MATNHRHGHASAARTFDRFDVRRQILRDDPHQLIRDLLA
jgi:hypothetical protein